MRGRGFILDLWYEQHFDLRFRDVIETITDIKRGLLFKTLVSKNAATWQL